MCRKIITPFLARGLVQDFFLCSLLLCNISAGWCD
nr:RepA leader peptide Tap [Escherichia coli]